MWSYFFPLFVMSRLNRYCFQYCRVNTNAVRLRAFFDNVFCFIANQIRALAVFYGTINDKSSDDRSHFLLLMKNTCFHLVFSNEKRTSQKMCNFSYYYDSLHSTQVPIIETTALKSRINEEKNTKLSNSDINVCQKAAYATQFATSWYWKLRHSFAQSFASSLWDASHCGAKTETFVKYRDNFVTAKINPECTIIRMTCNTNGSLVKTATTPKKNIAQNDWIETQRRNRNIFKLPKINRMPKIKWYLTFMHQRSHFTVQWTNFLCWNGKQKDGICFFFVVVLVLQDKAKKMYLVGIDIGYFVLSMNKNTIFINLFCFVCTSFVTWIEF